MSCACVLKMLILTLAASNKIFFFHFSFSSFLSFVFNSFFFSFLFSSHYKRVTADPFRSLYPGIRKDVPVQESKLPLTVSFRPGLLCFYSFHAAGQVAPNPHSSISSFTRPLTPKRHQDKACCGFHGSILQHSQHKPCKFSEDIFICFPRRHHY